MDPELIDEWGDTSSRKKGYKQLNAQAVLDKLTPLKPATVECFRDEGLAWVQVCFDDVISPGVVLKLGDAIRKAVEGVELEEPPVLFQALRPRSVYFIVNDRSLAIESDATLPATHYGVSLDELRAAWPKG
jgi:hypothetical protein